VGHNPHRQIRFGSSGCEDVIDCAKALRQQVGTIEIEINQIGLVRHDAWCRYGDHIERAQAVVSPTVHFGHDP
jgi:hypothetical protein